MKNGEMPLNEWAVINGEGLLTSADALRAADRLNRLQSVSAALAGAATVLQVAEVILDQGIAALEARAAAVALLTESGDELELVRATGYPSGIARRIPAHAPSMMAEATNTGKPVWLSSLEDLQTRYPLFASINATGNAFAALPLLIEGRPIGAVGFSFSDPGERTEADKAFLRTLAQQCAQAMARARLYDAARLEIAERRRAEEALRESEAMFRTLSNTVPDIIFATRPDGFCDYCNQRWYDFSGLTEEQTVGYGWTSALHPEDRERTNRWWEQAIRQGSAASIEYRLRSTAGDYHWFLARVAPMRDARNNVTKWFGSCTDIDDLKRAEAEIAALNTRLHRAVYEASHRIKNHLQMLASTVDMHLMSGRQRISTDQLRQLSAQIRTIAAIHDTLTADTKADGTVTALSVKALLDKVLWMLQQTTGHGVLRFYAEEVLLPVNGGAALAMVVTELVMNAIKHGGAQAEVIFLIEGKQGILSVADSGSGFAADFDPKAAAHTGLELVASLTRTDLKGHVRYENREEGGALVTVTFPLPAL